MTKTNTSCIVDTGKLITEFGDVEFIQTYQSRDDVKIYRDAQKALTSDMNAILLMQYQTEYKTAAEERKEELSKLIAELSEKIDKKHDMSKPLDALIMASFKGTKIKKGGYFVNGIEDTFTIEDLGDIPNAVYHLLSMNALKLVNVQEDEEKN